MDDDDCVAARRLAIILNLAKPPVRGRRVADTGGACHIISDADAEVADRDRIAMIAELANAMR